METLEKDDKNYAPYTSDKSGKSLLDEERIPYLLNKFTALGSTVDDVKAFMQPETTSGDVTYILKVELGSCMRKIRIGGRATLEKLHEAIQRAVDFDNDYMYCFTIGVGRTKKSYYHPFEITVEKILPEYTKNAEVVERKGDNPEQYWDEF